MTNEPDKEAEKLLLEYEVQADGLGVIAESGNLQRLVPEFLDIRRYLKRCAARSKNRKIVREVSAEPGLIDVSRPDNQLREMMYVSHLAVCCELFENCGIPVGSLTRTRMKGYAHALLDRNDVTSPGNARPWVDRLHHADAIRTAFILRLLGLYTGSAQQARQFSLACGSGSRDINGFHMMPDITNEGGTLNFRQHRSHPEHIILVDNGPEFTEYFDSVNLTSSANTRAMNIGVADALNQTAALCESGEMKRRNLIVGLRIDHLMFPDVSAFLHGLSEIIEPTADLIITIGAGHTDEEFEGRVEKISEFIDQLSDMGMEPVRIKLYAGSNLYEGRRTPCFGQLSFTTYEILYCRIKRKLLKP